jgi:hypothetical protein
MGAWGVKATESDYGLDLMAVIEERYLRKRNYEQFNVSEVVAFVKEHIIEQIRYVNRGASEKAMLGYIEFNFPGQYDQAVILIAEQLADYFEGGHIDIEVYERGKEPTIKAITNVIYTSEDLSSLLADLQSVLDPSSSQYCA